METQKVNTVDAILSSLKFEAIHFRHQEVVEAHSKTFKWILEVYQPRDMPEVHFLDWLQRKNGIYWISGKAGSGKSTLMKYLCDQERTMNALQQWAGDDRVVVASHYFWNAGHTLQKSQQGLLQTLLFEIFCQCPDLAFQISPSRWRSKRTLQSLQWTRVELIQTLIALKNQKFDSAAGSMRFCFFIDGLDEYEGDHQEICDILRDLASGDHIKICVSSRPWPVFQSALGTDVSNMLALQELTRNDIQVFVQDKLGADHRYIALRQQEDFHIDLAKEVTDNAQGVFLWVSLVVKELLDSIQNCDTISDLQRRLQHIPTSLEEYFRRMFDGLNPFYQKQASQIFLLLMEDGYLPLLALSVLEHEDPDYCIKAPIKPIATKDSRGLASSLRARLHGRCKDLIEVVHPPDSPIHSMAVTFIHRTVVDFLRDDSVHQKLETASGPGFDTLTTICRGLLIFLKQHADRYDYPERNYTFRHGVLKVLSSARSIENRQGTTEPALLFELERTATTWSQNPNYFSRFINCALLPRLAYEGSKPGERWQGFACAAAASGFLQFVIHLVEADPSLTESTAGGWLLCGAAYHIVHYFGNADLVSYLLQRGVSPNEEPFETSEGEAQSVWQFFLFNILYVRYSFESDPPVLGKLKSGSLKVAKLLIEAGAEPRSIIYHAKLYPYNDKRFSTEEALAQVFGPTDVDLLMEAFSDRRSAQKGAVQSEDKPRTK